MKTSNIALASALALAACGTSDHDDLDHVVWSATSPPGSSAEIDGDGTLVFAMSGLASCPESPCTPATLRTELPAGDFDVRFDGVVLDDLGEVGARIDIGEYHASAFYARYPTSQGVAVDVLGASEAESYGSGGQVDGLPEVAELGLARRGDTITARAVTDVYAVTRVSTTGPDAGTLTVYLVADDYAELPDTLGARFERRSLGCEMTTFADDAIEASR